MKITADLVAAYPKTKKVDFSEEIGGYTNHDPYVWLEKLHDPDVVNWVAQQNQHTDAWFDSEKVAERAAHLKDQYIQKRYSLPTVRGSRFYVIRTDIEGKTMPVILNDRWQEMQEVGAELTDSYNLTGMLPHPQKDNLVCLIGIAHGAHLLSALVYDLTTKSVLYCTDEVFRAVWATDGSLWYSQSFPNNELGYNYNPVCRWTPEGGAVTIYEAPRDRAYVTISAGVDGQVMLNSKFDFGSNELLCATAAGQITSLTGDIRARNEYVGAHDGVHYILTENDAPMG